MGDYYIRRKAVKKEEKDAAGEKMVI